VVVGTLPGCSFEKRKMIWAGLVRLRERKGKSETGSKKNMLIVQYSTVQYSTVQYPALLAVDHVDLVSASSHPSRRQQQHRIVMTHLKHHQAPPFRAEHLGSLLRPKSLLEKRKDVDDKKLDLKDLIPYEDDAVDSIVKTQVDLGFRAVSDGEYRYV
jgi:hypothetical protein